MERATENFIALTWAQRAHAELGAKGRFAQLEGRLKKNMALQYIIDMVVSAKEDEQRHALLCAYVAKSFGHKTGFADFNGASSPMTAPWEGIKNELSEKNKLLLEVCLMCCITETINASLLNTLYGPSKDTAPGKIIHEILKDEVKHGQIGWAYLASESEKRDCSFLAKYLPDMLEMSVKDELFLPIPSAKKGQDTSMFGVLPMAKRMDQFQLTLETIVLPGFSKFGIETSGAKSWCLRKMQGSHLSA